MILIISVSIITSILLGIIIYFAIKSQELKVESGEFTVIGSEGTTKTSIIPGKYGKVHIQGEIWQAISDETIEPDQQIVVTAIKSMTVKVIRKIWPIIC